jgi:hypothetical protein
MSIPVEYLNGLQDVAKQIDAICDGTFVSDAMIPEPLVSVMERLVEHIRILVRMYPNENLMTFAASANSGQAWIEEHR